MAAAHKPLNIDCENCGQSNPPSNAICLKCDASFAFLSKPTSAWEPSDYSQWLFANHFQLAQLAAIGGAPSLSRSHQLHFYIGHFYYQVLNGGMWQYLENPCGPDAPKLVEALVEIGAPRTAAVVTEALAFFPNGRPQEDDEERAISIEAIPEDVGQRLDGLAANLVNGTRSPEDLLRLLQRRCAVLESNGLQ